MLIPGVERQSEEAALLPLEGLLGTLLIPNRRAAPASENIMQVLVQMVHRIQLLARRDLAHVGAGRAFRPFHIDERAAAARSIPRFNFDLSEVLHKKGFHDRNSLAELPLVVVGNVIHHVVDLGCGLGHNLLQNFALLLSYTTRKSKLGPLLFGSVCS